MVNHFKTKIGRLRVTAFWEGVSLLILVGICVPVKYLLGQPVFVQIIGPIHGALFLLFVYYTFDVASQYKWKFMSTTWKVLLSSFIPFGTFYIDHTILKKVEATE